MGFDEPILLVGLVLVPLAVAAYVAHERNRRRAAFAFAAPAVMGSVAPRSPGWRRHVPIAVYAFALAVLILALARPHRTVAVPVERASIMLTTDYSGSMQAEDIQPTRWLAARAAAERFLDDVPSGVRVGLVAFNHSARLLESPSTDRDGIKSALRILQPSGGTATGEALAVALGNLERQKDVDGGRVPTAVILLSDGKSVKGRAPTVLAQRARALRIPIFTVALGTPDGTIEVTVNGVKQTRAVPPDQAEMQAVADISRGRAFNAQSAFDLSSVYKLLGSRIGYRDEEREITSTFAGGALALMLAGSLLSLHWFRRLV